MKNLAFLGHFSAIFTIIIWGSTFSATKVLLESFDSYEILVFRFVLAYICLFVCSPKILKITSIKEEFLFAMCGLSGVCLYFLLENIALEYTSASNAGVLVSISPIYTAILGFLLFKKSLNISFIVGFLLALVGVILIIFHKDTTLHINPLGDFLCLLAGISWTFYTFFLDKIFKIKKDTNTLYITKRIFFYGIIFSSLTLFINEINPSLERFLIIKNLFNLIFLGIFASALCYLSWGVSLKLLGTLKASAYLYVVPVVSVFVAFFTLKEPITISIVMGSALVLMGLILSQRV